jgi:hypothetical protein
MINAMAYTCTTCGKVMASEGGMEVHQASHVAESTVEAQRAEAARRAMEAAAQGGHPMSATAPDGSRPETPGLVLVLAGVIFFLLAAGLIGAANPHLVKKERVTALAAASIPDGYRTAGTDQFSLVVPAAWFDVDPSKGDITRALDNAAKANPKLGSYLTDKVRSAALQHLKFLSIDGTTGSNVNVASLGRVKGGVADIPVTDVEGELRRAGAVNVSNSRVHLTSGDALVESSQVPIAGRNVQITQYYMVMNHDGYVLTFTQGSVGPPLDMSTMASSFRTH